MNEMLNRKKLIQNSIISVIIAASVFLFIEMAYTFGFADNYIVSIWPAAAIFYWAVRKYGWWAAVPVFIGNALHNFYAGIPPFFMIANAANALAPIAGVRIEKKFNPSMNIFISYRGIITFLLGGLGVFSVIAAITGTLTVSLHFQLPPDALLTGFWRWFLSDYTGALVITPILLVLPDFFTSFSKIRTYIHPLLITIGTVIVIFIFLVSGLSEQYGHYPTILISMPAFLWLAFSKNSPRLTIWYFIISFASLLITIQTIGNLNDAGWLAIQLYLTMIITSGYILHTVFIERLYLLNELEYEKASLEQRVQDRTKELVAAQKKAESANRAKSIFLANISHDLRTPLNGIHGMMQLLSSTELTDQQHEYVSLSMNSCMFLSNLLGDILDLSRIESNRIQLSKENISFYDFFHSLVEVFKENTRQKKLQLIKEIDTNIPEIIVGDSLRVRQIMFNLISNAIKFTESGSITVSAHLKENDDPHKVYILFSVIDTGIGINNQNLSMIFEPFVQEKRSTENHEGVGLGLSIVKRLIDLLEGSIEIDSQPGKGTAFYITLPFDLPKDAKKPDTKKKKLPDSFKGYSVLLVEDDPINRYASKTILESMDFSVNFATNGKEALKMAKTEQYDCIFMDIQMPVLDGAQAAKLLRSDPQYSKNSETPIIALTAYAMNNNKEYLSEAGINSFISKPLSKASVIQSFHEIL